MGQHTIAMGRRKKIALVAHDNKKSDLLAWARFNKDLLARHELFATGTTGTLIGDSLKLNVKRLQSGPFGGFYYLITAYGDGV
jgi:methylglyoxal synthase